MTELFHYIVYSPKYAILEFGSGDSTRKIYDHFSKYTENLTLFSYESKAEFIKPYKGVQYILYDENNIQDITIPPIHYDLILIDGPNGDKRALWYSKIRQAVKPGTIILIDDFNHYKCFSDELDKNFNYELLSFSDEPFVPYGEHSWKIVRIINTI